MVEMRPRQHADYIDKLPSRQERIAALNKVPDHYRSLVVTYVTNTFERRRYGKN